MTQRLPGWYNYPDPPAGAVDYMLYWDGQNWTKRQYGWLPVQGKPGQVQLYADDRWVGKPMSEAMVRTMSAEDRLLSISAYTTPEQAVAQIKYLGPSQRLQNNRIDASVFNARVLAVALIPFLIIALFVIALIADSGLPPVLAAVILIIAAAFLIPAAIRTAQYLKRRRSEAKAFICSTEEAQAIPDGASCVVSGTVANYQGTSSFGQDHCVFFSFYYQYQNWRGNTKERNVTKNTDFCLEDDGSKIWVRAGQLRGDLLGRPGVSLPDAEAWVVLSGNQVSLTGKIITLSDGSRGFKGPVQLGFPVTAYHKKDRIISVNETDSARPEEEGVIGPAVARVVSGQLLPS